MTNEKRFLSKTKKKIKLENKLNNINKICVYLKV